MCVRVSECNHVYHMHVAPEEARKAQLELE